VHALASTDPRAPAVLDAARRSARVTDPHFLRVLDCDDVDGLTWVINEWGEGASLDVMLERSTLPPTRAAWLAREVAEAIAAAHADGLYHGRLSPESVLVSNSGSVKIIGFVVNAAFEGPVPVHPAYGALGPREADVIDLAGILYAALTGRWPGVAPSTVPRAPRDGRRPLRPRQVRAGVPRTLDAICERVLHKEAAQHAMPIETAHEIAAALSDFVGDPAAAAPVDVPSMYADPAAPEPGKTDAMPLLGDFAGAADDDAGVTPDDAPLTPVRTAPVQALQDTEGAPPAHLPPDRRPDLSATMASPAPIWTEEFSEPEAWHPAPPVAPLEDLPARPLFADHERRVPAGAPPPPAVPERSAATGDQGPATSAGKDPATEGGTGSRYWPFDDPDATGGFSGKEGRSWLQLAAIVAVCIAVVVAVILAFSINRGKDKPAATSPTTSPATPTATGSPIRIVKAQDFDPEGDPPEENPDQVPLAIDGKPDTGWRTLTYKDDAHLGGLKSGVGLVLDLGSEKEIGSVEVRLVGSPTDLELFAAPPGHDSPPTELADTRRVAALSGAGTTALLRPDAKVRSRFVVVWLTSLPAVGGGFRGEIAEVEVRS